MFCNAPEGCVNKINVSCHINFSAGLGKCVTRLYNLRTLLCYLSNTSRVLSGFFVAGTDS